MKTINKDEAKALLVLLLLGIAILSYGYKFGYFYGKVDSSYFELGSYKYFTKHLYLWNTNAALGELYSLFFSLFFVKAYTYLLSVFFNYAYQVNFFGLFFLNLSFPIVTFFFLRSFTSNRNRKFTILISMLSLISLLNIHFLQINVNPIYSQRFGYIFFCLIITLINHYLKNADKKSLYILLIVVFLSNISWNLFQFWVPYLILIFSYTLFLLFTRSIDLRKFLIGWVTFFLLNAVSLFSILFYVINTPLSSTEAFRYADNVYSYANANSKLTNITAFIGGVNWNNTWGWNDVQVYSFSKELSSNAFLLICRYLLFLLFLYNLLNSRIKSKKNNFTVSVILITVFMIASYNPPFGKIFDAIYKSSSLMKIFRESHNKFYPILFLGVCVYISKNFTNSTKTTKVTYAFLTIYIISFVYILFKYSLYSPESFFKIPEQYVQISEQIEGGNRVLILPSYAMVQLFSYDLYGRNPFDFLIDSPIISLSQVLESNYNRKATLKVLNDFNPEHLKSFFFIREGEPLYDINILRKYGVRYLILDGNVIGYPYFNSEDFKLLAEKFIDNKDYNLILKSGSLTLYEVVGAEDSYFDTRIVDYKIINPTKYAVEMTTESDIEELIFKQSYDKNWKMYPVGNENDLYQIENNFLKDILFLTEKDIQGENHVSNDNYLNQWNIDIKAYEEENGQFYVIDNQDGSKTIKFILYYKPQSYFYLFLLVSTSTFLISLLYISSDIFNKVSNRLFYEKKTVPNKFL